MDNLNKIVELEARKFVQENYEKPTEMEFLIIKQAILKGMQIAAQLVKGE